MAMYKESKKPKFFFFFVVKTLKMFTPEETDGEAMKKNISNF